MRVVVLVLMMLLLPLRGWAGDVMATGMATQANAATQNHHPSREVFATYNAANHVATAATRGTIDAENAVHDAATPEAAHAGHSGHDCDEPAVVAHADTAHPDGFEASAAAEVSQACPSCQFCQVCHTLVLQAVPAELAPADAVAELPQFAASRFASADAAQGQKPPIS